MSSWSILPLRTPPDSLKWRSPDSHRAIDLKTPGRAVLSVSACTWVSTEEVDIVECGMARMAIAVTSIAAIVRNSLSISRFLEEYGQFSPTGEATSDTVGVPYLEIPRRRVMRPNPSRTVVLSFWMRPRITMSAPTM